jgi:dihydrolipoamide dehydrogenase
MTVEVRIPDIGDFEGVEVIELLVSVGDTVAIEDALISLESDKATMEIPSPLAGVVEAVKVAVGDTVSEGDLILMVEAAEAPAADPQATATTETVASPPSEAAATSTPVAPRTVDIEADLLVLGSGPGGYTAAFRAADLGKRVVMVERHGSIGGVCLNVGCIPSKALLHTAQVINEASTMADHGVRFTPPEVDIDKIRAWKEGVVTRLTGGLGMLAKQRKVKVVTGEGRFTSPHTLLVQTAEGEQTIGFENAIIAAGSRPVEIPRFLHEDPRVWDSTDALRLREVPARLLIIGGGIIGLEMATVYEALGSKVTVVERHDALIHMADKDIVRPLLRRVEKRYEAIYLNAEVARMEAEEDGIRIHFEGGKAPAEALFDAVLVSVGRSPNGHLIGAEEAGVAVNEQGFITVDEQMRTNQSHIFAIGDIVGQPMLAHKATHEAKVAAEVIAGHKAAFEPLTIPSVAYTDPEIAWAGVTEAEAKAQGIDYTKGAFPWAASGRSLSIGRDEGMTKALFDKESGRLIGAAMVGTNAGELIAEAVLGIEMGADMEDIGLTIHPHPTLSETLCFAAEMAEGTITDLMPPKKR